MEKQYIRIEAEIIYITEDIVTASNDFGPGQFDNTADDVYDFVE